MVLKIHEVWHFPQSRQGLFAEYVNTWLKIKEEASGWPTDCRTQESRAQHLHDYARREGIYLDYDQVQHNPGRRALAKMMLNSMWGKFGQRHNKMQVREFAEPQAFHEFLDSDQNDIRYVSTLTEDRVEVHYTKQDHCESLSPNLNIFVACFTTCWARLRLYEALQLLGEQVLYFDTDSVVFAHRPVQASPALGQYLGEFKDELGHGDSIVEFCSAGPKNYGYKTRAGKTVCKCEGSRSTAKAPRNSITRCCAKTSWTSCTPPWSNPAPHASPSPTPSNARPKTTPYTPDPPTKITVWCAANVWWIPRRLRAIRTATRGWFELATSTLVAQQVERWTLDPRVAGSSPAEGKKTDFSSSSFIFSSR